MKSQLSVRGNARIIDRLKTSVAAIDWVPLLIGLNRRLLDQAERHRVKAQRERGADWAEIATKHGVTTQEAHERWGDLGG